MARRSTCCHRRMRGKDDFKDGKATALKAVKASPANGEAHFWLAECERHLSEAPCRRRSIANICRLTNFNSGAGGQVNYYLVGFLLGMGKKHRAAEQDIWRRAARRGEPGDLRLRVDAEAQ